MRYTIVRTVEKLSQKPAENGSIDYIFRRTFRALPAEDVEHFISEFQGEASDALALFEVDTKDVAAILYALQELAREVEVNDVMRPEG